MSLARGPLSLKFNYFIAHAMLTPLPSLKENTHGGNSVRAFFEQECVVSY